MDEYYVTNLDGNWAVFQQVEAGLKLLGSAQVSEDHINFAEPIKVDFSGVEMVFYRVLTPVMKKSEIEK